MPDDLSDLFDEAISATQQPAEHPITAELAEPPEDRYYQAAQIAHGGLKNIEVVEDRVTGRTLARARPRHDAPEAHEAFLREARITANLTHPNVVPVYDLGIDADGVPFFTMKLIEGDNLAVCLRNRTAANALPGINNLGTRIDLFLKVCDGIAYAHSRGVIHLDIKPENIQLGRFGEVLVCDWGIAKIQDEAVEDPHLERYSFDAHERRHLTLGGTIKGTPGYMAPEQCGAFNSQKDHRTDVFSLGCILYELASFRRPIATANVASAVRNTRQGKLRPIPDTVPPGLAAIIRKALQHRPADRYQSVDELSRDLAAWRTGYATTAENPGIGRQLSLFYRRNRFVCLLSGAFFAALAAIVASFVIQLQISESAARDALARAEWEQNQRQKLGSQASPLLIDRAQLAFRRGRFDETQSLLDGLFSIAPDNPRIHNLQADLHFAMGRPGPAAATYREPLGPFESELLQWLRRRPYSPETPLADAELLTLIQLIRNRQPPAGMAFLLAWKEHPSSTIRTAVHDALTQWRLPTDYPTLLELLPDLPPAVADACLNHLLQDRRRLPPDAIASRLPMLLELKLSSRTRDLLIIGPRANLAPAARLAVSHSDTPTEYLVDDQLDGPAWRSNHRPTEITIDMRAPKLVASIALYPVQQIPAHTLSISLDGNSFQRLDKVPTLPAPSGHRPYVHRFEPASVRFIRFSFPDYNQQRPLELREIQVYGPMANLALGRPTSGDGGIEAPGRPTAIAVNGNAPLNEYFERNDPPIALTVDLQSPQPIDEVHLGFYFDGRRYYQYQLATSLDNQDYTLAVDRSTNRTVSRRDPYVDRFPARVARFVRLTVLHNSANPGVHVREIQIFPARDAPRLNSP